MPKVNMVTAFAELQNKGVISEKDPNTLFSNLIQIGNGNFGFVYRATNTATGEIVAIKKLKLDTKRKQSTENINEIIREITFLNDVQHKNCVQSKGCFLEQSVPWLIMEYCLGSVADILEFKKVPLKEIEIACISNEVLTGLVFLHKNNFIHRDIKAANILLTEDGGVKIADFGSASLKTPANSFVGTPFWIAPDVILAMESGLYGSTVDVWSVGITCIEMAELKPPYMELANNMSALYQIVLNSAPSLQSDNWSSTFHNFIKYVLVKEGDRRPSSTDALNHPFCSSIQNPLPVIIDLVQRAVASVKEENQLRPKFVTSTKTPTSKNNNIRNSFFDVNQDLNSDSSRCGSQDNSNGNHRDLSFDRNIQNGVTESTSTGTSSSNSLHASSKNIDAWPSKPGLVTKPKDVIENDQIHCNASGELPQPTESSHNKTAKNKSTNYIDARISKHNSVEMLDGNINRNKLSSSEQASGYSPSNVHPSPSLPSSVTDIAAKSSTDLHTPSGESNLQQNKTQLTRTKTRNPADVAAASKIGNFPTLKSKVQLSKSQYNNCDQASGDGFGPPQEDNQIFYDFRLMRNRHTEKLERERKNNERVVNAKLESLNREYANFESTKKKETACQKQQHVNELKLFRKKLDEEEVKYSRQLDLDLKEQLKKATHRGRSRPNSTIGYPLNSNYSESISGQSNLDSLTKKLQADNRLKMKRWKYGAIKRCFEKKMSLFEEHKKLEDSILNEQITMLIQQLEQVKSLELEKHASENQLRVKFLEVESNFYHSNHQRLIEKEDRYLQSQKASRYKALLKTFKSLEDSSRAPTRMSNLFAIKKKTLTDSSRDASNSRESSKDVHKSWLQQKKDELEQEFKEKSLRKSEELEVQLKNKQNYIDANSHDLRIHLDQNDKKLREKIRLREKSIHESFKRHEQKVLGHTAKELRWIEQEFASDKQKLECECNNVGIDFHAVQMNQNEFSIPTNTPQQMYDNRNRLSFIK